jgi:hypothetical protein
VKRTAEIKQTWRIFLPFAMLRSIKNNSYKTYAGLYHICKGKGKVKLSLCLNKHHVMKTYWGSGGIPPRILDVGTRWR